MAVDVTLEKSRGWSAGRWLLVLAGAIALGLVLQEVLGAHLAQIVALAEHDKLAARAELARVVRAVIGGACALTAALGLALAHACRKPSAAKRFPPPGLLSLGARRTLTGPRARTFTRIGLALGLALCAASLAGLGCAWYLAAVLEACRS
jgi:hypothetical protein